MVLFLVLRPSTCRLLVIRRDDVITGYLSSAASGLAAGLLRALVLPPPLAGEASSGGLLVGRRWSRSTVARGRESVGCTGGTLASRVFL